MATSMAFWNAVTLLCRPNAWTTALMRRSASSRRALYSTKETLSSRLMTAQVFQKTLPNLPDTSPGH